MSTTKTKPTKAPVLQLHNCYTSKEPSGMMFITQTIAGIADSEFSRAAYRSINSGAVITIRQEDVPALRNWINEQWPKES